jgi:hypothetical protein
MARSPPSKSTRNSITLKAVATSQVALSQSFQNLKYPDLPNAFQGSTPFCSELIKRETYNLMDVPLFITFFQAGKKHRSPVPVFNIFPTEPLLQLWLFNGLQFPGINENKKWCE